MGTRRKTLKHRHLTSAVIESGVLPVMVDAPPLTEAPPDWLSPDAQRIWHEYFPMLRKAGVLSDLDRHTLGSYCVTAALLEDKAKYIAQHGTVDEAGGPRAEFGQLLRLQQQVARLAESIGLSPGSRAKIGAGGVEHAPGPLDTFMQIVKSARSGE